MRCERDVKMLFFLVGVIEEEDVGPDDNDEDGDLIIMK